MTVALLSWCASRAGQAMEARASTALPVRRLARFEPESVITIIIIIIIIIIYTQSLKTYM